MNRRIALLSLSLAGLVGCTEPDGPWVLAWEDDFSGAAGALPNQSNWRFDVGTDWGNAQLEFDTDRASNASLDGSGHLVITARQESFRGSGYTSARLTTQGKQEFKYGRFEARIKMPSGRGIWPAFWLLGANEDVVGWPQAGEIDIMEYRGQEPSVVNGTLHGPGYSGSTASRGATSWTARVSTPTTTTSPSSGTRTRSSGRSTDRPTMRSSAATSPAPGSTTIRSTSS
ncbi:MAG: glycoside hydrolase family 16 protein [Gemmatimonadetes bacterium]|nr:glycoside hydrolase family 16 protein [Gemmatimonadota bacterium]